ncbi:MAG TPA: hypothetical protein VKE98_01390, partial [Gemmataceae bacterium]|nr:hypothetical protein [Gemmataceae bacterium]
TGTTPCDQERLKTAAFDEIRRMIREEEPATPSRKITTLGAAATAVSANRKSDPRRLSQLVRGDLDWIVMKALEKDRNRRYDTSGALAADVLRYLNDEPVLACPPSTIYRLRRIVRRHKGPVVAATLVILALVAGMIGTTWGMLQANDAQATAVEETGHKEEALKAKVAALADAKDKLHLALLSQARAARGSGRLGQRFQALKAIRQAAQIRMTAELRDEAIAALVLPDAEIACEWEGWPEGTAGLSFDSAFQRYARIDKQGGITVCQLSDGREKVVFPLRAHGKPAFGHPGLSPDGRFLIYGHGGTEASSFPKVRVWKLDGPEPVVLLDEAMGMSEFAATFHATSPRLALGHRDKTISVYDLNTGRRVRQLTVSAVPSHLAFHPRDNRLAAACGNVVQIFETDTGRELPRLRHPTGMRTSSVAWHPDGRRLATGSYDRKIRIWDTETATEVMPPWVGHTLEGIRLTFNRAGDRLVSHDWGIQTRLWDVATGRMLLTLPDVFGGQFSPDDSLFGFGRSGNKLQLYRVVGGRELRVLRRRYADSLERISYPVVHADGRTVAASGDNWLSFFNLATGDELGSVRLPYKYAADPVFFDFPGQSDGKAGNDPGGWMTGGYGGMFRWPARSDQLRPEVLRVGPAEQLAPGLMSAYARGSSASKDGQVVAVPQGNSTAVLHRNDPERRKVLGPQYDVRFTAVSPDGRWVVTSSHWPDGRSKSAWIWDAGSGKKVHELPLEGSTAAGFSPDGRWLVTRTSVGCRLWEVGTWRPAKHIATNRGSFAFSPDSRLLAINDVFSVIRLLETATGREVARLTGPEPLWYPPACFSPDGTRLVATCSDTTALFVWDLRLIRQQLKELRMDWDWPEFQPSDAVANSGPSRVEVHLGDLVKFIQTPEQKAQQTIERYRADVKGNPKDAKACNGVAWLYLTAPQALRDVKAAVPLAEKAVSLVPENGIYRNTLGLAYYRVGRYREAVDTL